MADKYVKLESGKLGLRTAGQLHQLIGVAVNATTINTDIDDCILL
jgi:hypothetical protein